MITLIPRPYFQHTEKIREPGDKAIYGIIHCFCVYADLNTLDWGKNNLVAIGLGPDVFLWNAGDGSVRKLLELNREGDYVCSVSWAGNGKYLAVGSESAAIQLWDVEKEKRVRTMGGHTDRVGVLTWSKHTLTRYVYTPSGAYECHAPLYSAHMLLTPCNYM